jgi:hypothetical protein
MTGLSEASFSAHRLVRCDVTDRDDLVVEAPGVLRRRRPLVRAKRPRVLFLP